MLRFSPGRWPSGYLSTRSFYNSLWVTKSQKRRPSSPVCSSRYSCAPASCSARNSPSSGLPGNFTNDHTPVSPFTHSPQFNVIIRAPITVCIHVDRITDQKMAVKILVTLYSHSSDIPGRSDTLKDAAPKDKEDAPTRFFRRALKGVRVAATTTTTAFGNVASEIAGR